MKKKLFLVVILMVLLVAINIVCCVDRNKGPEPLKFKVPDNYKGILIC